MKLKFILVLLVGLCLLHLGSSACAEGMQKDAYTSTLLDLNRIKPNHNPAFTLGKNELSARVLDKNQKTIGKVEDIVLAPDGKFQTIMTKIDASGFREDVSFDVASYVVAPTPDTVTISMDKTQIKQNLSKLMAAVTTASGETAPFTLTSIQRGVIDKRDGSEVAKVKDVLIDSRAQRIVALLVTISIGHNRGSVIAIPYEAAGAKHESEAAVLTVTDEQADIMTSMATRR